MAITLEVIAERLDNLAKSVNDGFKGVHERQDKTNGKVQKNTEWRLMNSKSVSLIWAGVMITITAVLTGGIALIIK